MKACCNFRFWSVSFLSLKSSIESKINTPQRRMKLMQKSSDSDENLSSHHHTKYDLQTPHPIRSPSEKLESLARACEILGIDDFDVYGDFTANPPDTSHLRRFENELAEVLGKEDAVFMPSGVMAQNIALLIHSQSNRSREKNSEQKNMFACHHTSHLVLHEQNAYRDLLGMEALIISTSSKANENKEGYDNEIGTKPMSLVDVQNAFEDFENKFSMNDKEIPQLATLILEIPHRELGGKLTPYDDILQISKLCKQKGVKYHCDGARIFEAVAGYNHQNNEKILLKEVVEPFDSVYVSFYKGLGSISGAMLFGTKEFCDEARVWLRRFGGNLYTLLPYYASSWAGYRQNFCLQNGFEMGASDIQLMTFGDKVKKIVRVVNLLSTDDDIKSVVTFDPKIPETNMVHVYIKGSVSSLEKVRDEVESKYGIKVFKRIREISLHSQESALGYESMLELGIGDANGNIPDDVFLKGWKNVSYGLKQIQGST